MRIMVVDDEAPIREWVAMCVQQYDPAAQVQTCRNGVEAIAALEASACDIVITDIVMPRMDGLTLLETLHERWPETAVVLLTGHGDFEYARHAIKNGVSDYILKTEIDRFQLGKILDRLLKTEVISPSSGHTANTAPRGIGTDLITPERISDSVQHAIQFMEKNYQNHISLSDVASAIHLSDEYFSRLFKRDMGRTFTEHLTGMRMRHAYELLSTTNMRVSEVGECVGIPNAKYFSLLFRKYFNASPSQLRDKS